MTASLGVAVIGAGSAGRLHAAAYRAAYEARLPQIRLVSIADISEEFGSALAQRYGYERNDTSWQAIAAADDIDVVSVVLANSLHREVVEGLLAAGKHVLCEKPLSDSVADGRAMAAAAQHAVTIARVGLTYRRSPGFAYAQSLVQSGELGNFLHFSGRYWTDYAVDRKVPMSWRYKGAPGSGALADIGSHLTDLAEFIVGDQIRSVNGGRFTTVIDKRPVPLEHVSGRGIVRLSDEMDTVENEDYASFSAILGEGVASFEVSRVAAGNVNTLAFEAFFEKGALSFDFRRPSEVGLMLTADAAGQQGFRQVVLSPDHPYVGGRYTIGSARAGFSTEDGFTVQARAFLEEVAGFGKSDSLPRCASFDEGVHNMELLQAVSESALGGGTTVAVPAREEAGA